MIGRRVENRVIGGSIPPIATGIQHAACVVSLPCGTELHSNLAGWPQLHPEQARAAPEWIEGVVSSSSKLTGSACRASGDPTRESVLVIKLAGAFGKSGGDLLATRLAGELPRSLRPVRTDSDNAPGMRIQVLENGVVINTSDADQAFSDADCPREWRVAAKRFEPAPAVADKPMTVNSNCFDIPS